MEDYQKVRGIGKLLMIVLMPSTPASFFMLKHIIKTDKQPPKVLFDGVEVYCWASLLLL